MKHYFKQANQNTDHYKRAILKITHLKKTEYQKIHTGIGGFLLICSFLLNFNSSLNAQNKFGFQLGANYNFEKSDIGNYNFGVFYKVPLSENFIVEPSLNFFPFGSKTTTMETKENSYYSSLHKKTIYTTINKENNTKNDAISVNIPVIFAYRLNLSEKFGLQFGLGPYLYYLSSGQVTINTITTTRNTLNHVPSIKTESNEIDTDSMLSWGGMLRFGFFINNFSVNTEYTGYDSKAKKAFDSKSLTLRLGYHF